MGVINNFTAKTVANFEEIIANNFAVMRMGFGTFKFSYGINGYVLTDLFVLQFITYCYFIKL